MPDALYTHASPPQEAYRTQGEATKKAGRHEGIRRARRSLVCDISCCKCASYHGVGAACGDGGCVHGIWKLATSRTTRREKNHAACAHRPCENIGAHHLASRGACRPVTSESRRPNALLAFLSLVLHGGRTVRACPAIYWYLSESGQQRAYVALLGHSNRGGFDIE